MGAEALSDVLSEGGFDYANAYSIYDYLGYQAEHNSTTAAALESTSGENNPDNITDLDQLRFLAVYPHGHAINISTKGDLAKHDNRNPKSTTLIEKTKQRLSPQDFAAYERAESCHRNALENMPLFVAGIFAGLLAEKETGRDLGASLFAASWLVVRTLYTINYINTASIKWSYARSALYFIGTFLCFGMIGRAAFALD